MDKARFEEIKARAGTYRELFSSELGKAVLEDLRREFFGTPFRSTVYRGKDGKVDPFGMAYNTGCREVLQHIEAMMRISENPEQVVGKHIELHEPSTNEMLAATLD